MRIEQVPQFLDRYEYARQVLTYLMVGGAAAIADLALLYVLVDLLRIFYLVAAALSFLLVATAAFFCHKRLTFRHRGQNNRLRYVLFLLTAGSGLFWSVLLLYVFVDFFGIWYLEAAIIEKGIVVVWNFLLSKYLTFGSRF
jgi:putative flippase GtrA